MKQSDRLRVAVLYGGRSAEHEVSLQSAINVVQNLDTNRFDIIPIGIDKQGNWFVGHEVLKHSLQHNAVTQIPGPGALWFTPEWIGKSLTKSQSNFTIDGDHKKPIFDVVFPALHGTTCEDGSLQGLLELANIPYVGCGVLSSAIGMDKDFSKRLAMQAGIPVGPFLVIKQKQWQQQQDTYLKKITTELTFPVFVKPANTGSSIGITKVKSLEQLTKAIDSAFKFDTKVLVEQALVIKELEIAILESYDQSEPIVSLVGEIKPRHEFYSYDAKYIDDQGAELVIPADIPEKIKIKAQQYAQQLFQILECEGMARVDLFYDPSNDEVYFNEINTLPGFTKISMYPKLMAASGIDYSTLMTHLVELAVKRFNIKTNLIRNFISA